MTPQQTKILELAGRVQYVTIRHLLEQGIFNAEYTARTHVRDLVSRGLLNVHNFGVQVGFGRLPALYGLTPSGVRYLTDEEYHDPKNIKASKSQKAEMKAPRDFHHRVGLIDSMLAIFRYLDSVEIRDEWSELYFRKHGMHEPKRTAIELEGGRLEPDALLRFTDETGRVRLYLVEFYEDEHEVERIRRALTRHAEALKNGQPSIVLGVQVGHRVLCVFRHEHTARAIMHYLETTPEYKEMVNRFLCVTLDALKKDPFGQWATPNRAKTTLY